MKSWSLIALALLVSAPAFGVTVPLGGSTWHVKVTRPLHSGGERVDLLEKGEASWVSSDPSILRVAAFGANGGPVNEGQFTVINSGASGQNKSGRVFVHYAGTGTADLLLTVRVRDDAGNFVGQPLKASVKITVADNSAPPPTVPVIPPVAPTPTLIPSGVVLVPGEP